MKKSKILQEIIRILDSVIIENTVAQAMAKGICMAFPPEPEMGNCILPAGHPGPHQDKLHNGWSQSMKKSELKEMIREELVKIREEFKSTNRPHGADKGEHAGNESAWKAEADRKRADAERERQAKQKEGDAKRADAERNRQSARKEADAKRTAADAKRKAVQEIVREEIAKLRRR